MMMIFCVPSENLNLLNSHHSLDVPLMYLALLQLTTNDVTYKMSNPSNFNILTRNTFMLELAETIEDDYGIIRIGITTRNLQATNH